MNQDRRTGRERRRSERYAITIEVEWDNAHGKRRKGTVSDISDTGCFILSSGEVEFGDKITLYIFLRGGKVIKLFGEVVDKTEDIGVAIRFFSLGENEKFFIEKLISKLKERDERAR